MWFLLIQIIFFMALAAGLGALAAWWWLRRRFVDVTETHAELTRQVEAAVAEGRVLTREDVKSEILNALSGYRPPETDLGPLVGRLNAIDARLSNDPRLETLTTRIGAIESSVGALAPMLSAIPEQQAAGLATHFERLSERLDLSPLHVRLEALDGRMSDIKLPDSNFAPLLARLAE
ncbi:MAG: hypothetical protein ACK46Q_15120, partial [Hyphomonas sp.]